MKISERLLDQIITQALQESPRECCGMIGTRGGVAVQVYPCVNVATNPFRYEIGGQEQFATQTRISESGLELGAIYHSHTRSDPVPSQTDIDLAYYPDTVYMIVGIKGVPEVRGYKIASGNVREVEIEVL